MDDVHNVINGHVKRVILNNLPVPPTSNHQYTPMSFSGINGKQFTRIISSRQLREYQKSIGDWRLKNNINVGGARVAFRNWIQLGFMVRVDTFICLPFEKLWTIKGMPKTYDVCNRFKALHDSIAYHTEVDDKNYWAGWYEKIESKREDPWCFLICYPFKPRTLTSLGHGVDYSSGGDIS